MECKLVGYRKGSIVNKDTGEVSASCTLYMVRKPNLRESDVKGLVAFQTSVYGTAVDALPVLEEGKEYNCDVGYSKGRYYLNEIEKK